MSWAATAITVGSVAGGSLQGEGASDAASQQIEARNNAIRNANRARRRVTNQVRAGNFQGQFGNEDVFGSRPEAIPFESLNLDDTLHHHIFDETLISQG